jgi:hypothetical protein
MKLRPYMADALRCDEVADAAIGAIGGLYVHEVTPQSLLTLALWGYLKCTLSERNNSNGWCDVCGPYGCGRNEVAPLHG